MPFAAEVEIAIDDLLTNLVADLLADLSADIAGDLLANLSANFIRDDLAVVLARTTGVNASSVELVRRHTYKERYRMKVWA